MKMRKWLRRLALIFCGGVFLYAGWNIVQILATQQEDKQLQQELSTYVVIPEDIETLEPEEVAQQIELDATSLAKMNPDYRGFLWIPQTNIAYPLVQARDNSYYLNHNFLGQSHFAGSIFLDYRSFGDFTGNQTIIYGHKVDYGTMFSQLEKFSSQAFFDGVDSLYLTIADITYPLTISSFGVYDATGFIYQTSVPLDQRPQYLAQVAAQAMYVRDLDWQAGDQIVTLSTCVSFDANNTQRYVLQARLRLP
ncbi:MAG: class B sortase [Erysipelotrichaceae bacterium]